MYLALKYSDPVFFLAGQQGNGQLPTDSCRSAENNQRQIKDDPHRIPEKGLGWLLVAALAWVKFDARTSLLGEDSCTKYKFQRAGLSPAGFRCKHGRFASHSTLIPLADHSKPEPFAFCQP